MAVTAADKLPQTNQSMRAHKVIRVRTQQPKEATKLSKQFDLSPVAARILAARKMKADDTTRHYLEPTLKSGLPNPSDLKNLPEACELIGSVIEAGGSIAVCCDFDVDGLTGGSIVTHCLRSLGVTVEPFVPDRFTDGYGLNEQMVRQAAENGHALLITIDYGTTNTHELQIAKEIGLKTIVIDHHHVGTHSPPCDVFINPQQSGCGFADKTLCAAGLAWYLVIGLRQFVPQAASINPKDYLDLACLGTICDMVPLVGANRVIAKRGLELLGTTKRAGLQELKDVISVRREVTCTHVGFGIGPRINAAGRMIHGNMVIELLTTSDLKLARKIAGKLNRLNLERQDTEGRIKELAIQRIESGSELPWGIVVADPDFHTGVIGIVAQRLVETFYRPAAVLGKDGDSYKGSVRGIRNFSVVDTLAAVGEYLEKFGGHEGAGGFSVKPDKLEQFTEAFNAECKQRLASIETSPTAEADTIVSLSEVTLDLIDELKQFAPFGIGNPSAQLLVEKLRVMDVRVLKAAHLKVVLTDGENSITGLMWHKSEHPDLVPGARIRAVFKPSVNLYNGQRQIQAHLQAVERD